MSDLVAIEITERDSMLRRIEELETALTRIWDMGQSAVPDDWAARQKCRNIARAALEREKNK